MTIGHLTNVPLHCSAYVLSHCVSSPRDALKPEMSTYGFLLRSMWFHRLELLAPDTASRTAPCCGLLKSTLTSLTLLTVICWQFRLSAEGCKLLSVMHLHFTHLSDLLTWYICFLLVLVAS
jgi:hypothetical protein